MLAQNTWLKKLGLNTICELLHQIFLHTQEAGTDINLGLIYTQEHHNIKKVALFISSSRRIGSSPMIMDYVHSTTLQNNLDKSCCHILGCLVMFDIPIILATHAVKLSGAPLPTLLSATTKLPTIGYGCFMKRSNTSRHELTFWSPVPAANIKWYQN